MERLLDSPAETSRVAQVLGRVLAAGDAVGLVGDLGAGKTHFVQGVALGLEVPPEIRVTSPTFTLLNEYRGGRHTLFHADLFRLERAEELRELGIDHALSTGGVLMVEWSDRFPVLPADHLLLQLAAVGNEVRRLRVDASGPAAKSLLERWQPQIP